MHIFDSPRETKFYEFKQFSVLHPTVHTDFCHILREYPTCGRYAYLWMVYNGSMSATTHHSVIKFENLYYICPLIASKHISVYALTETKQIYTVRKLAHHVKVGKKIKRCKFFYYATENYVKRKIQYQTCMF